MYKIFISLLLLIQILSSQNDSNTAYTYVINPGGNPYEYLSGDGQHSGMTKDYLELIKKNIFFNLELVPTKNWSESKQFLQDDKVDIVFASSPTKSRKKYLFFSDVYLKIYTAAITRKDFSGDLSLESLVKQKVTTITGYSTAKKLKRDYPNIKITYTNSIAECLLAVSNGKSDVAFLNLAIASHGIRENLFTNLKILKATKYSHNLSIGARKNLKNSRKIIKAFNQSIAKITAQDRDTIIEKWIKLSPSTISYIDKQTLIYIAIAFSAFFIPMIWYSMKLKSFNKELHILATVDTLTRVYNRRFLLDAADMEITRVIRNRHKLSFLMFDIDKFKDFNDTYGHSVGDKALIIFAQTIQKTKRKSDIFARIGGEEFCLLALDTDIENSCIFADKLRQAVEEAIIPAGSKKIKMTVSIGVTIFKYEQDSIEAMMERADIALYKAKENGRNRVEREE